MPQTAPSERTRVRRAPQRAAYDRATIDAILDEGFVCHVGFVADGSPVVIPANYARVADTLYLHGSTQGRMMRTLRSGADVCVTVTLVDGLVLARSLAHHSMNYRSVMVFGRGREVTDAGERDLALRAVTEAALPGRWDEARAPNRAELAETMVVAISIDEASAKVRSGPPADDPADVEAGGRWAGEVPLRQVALPPVPEPGLDEDVPAPACFARFYTDGDGR